MLETLLESNAKGQLSSGGAIVSVMAHTALIAGALYATAQAHVRAVSPVETVRTVYFPPGRPSISLPRARAGPRPPSLHLRTLPLITATIDAKIPPLALGDIVSTRRDLGHGIPAPATATTSDDGAGVPTDSPFRADQVEKQVALVAGSWMPRYPESLRNSGVEGRVVAEFVVDERGRAEEGSVRFISSGNPLFEDAVKVALRRMRFIPAEVGGRKVKQLVQMPFVFTLDR